MKIFKFSGELIGGVYAEIVVNFVDDCIKIFEDYVNTETHFMSENKNGWEAAYELVRKFTWKDKVSAALACDGFYWEEITENELAQMTRIGDMIETELRRELRKVLKIN